MLINRLKRSSVTALKMAAEVPQNTLKQLLSAVVLTIIYVLRMQTLIQTEIYKKWFAALRDGRAKARINARLRRVELGGLGDCKPVGEGVSELRIDYGPGYRIYFIRKGYEVIILLAGGDKSTQARDIRLALELARIV